MAGPIPTRPTIRARASLAFTALLWRLRKGVIGGLAAVSPDHPLRRAHAALRQIGLVQTLWRRWVFDPGGRAVDPAAYAAAGGLFGPGPSTAGLDPIGEIGFDALIARAEACETPYDPVAGRILIVNCGLACGGAERQIVTLAHGLVARGVDVVFLGESLARAPGLDFYLDRMPPGRASPTRREIKVDGRLYAGVTRPVAEALACLPQPELLEVLDMVAELRARRPAVLHLWQDQTSVKHGLAAVIAGTPRIVLSGRNVDPSNFAYDRPWLRSGYRALARSSRVQFTNNSDAGARSYADWLGLPADRFTVVRNGVELSDAGAGQRAAAEALREAAAGAPLIGSVIRLSAEKRPLLLLESLAALGKIRPECRFVIAGDGPLHGEVEAAARTLGLTDRLTLLGEVDDIVPVLLSLDLLLMTSQFEGTPNAALEAQWSGKPVLITEAGGAAEAIEPGATGRIVASDPHRIAEAAAAMLSDPDWAGRAERNGRVFVRRRYGVARMIDETQALYFGGPGGASSAA
jgi:glycosyltransferase involved in cell wall biosynthesis